MSVKSVLKKGLMAANFQKLTALRNTCYIITYHRIPIGIVKDFEQQIHHLVKNYKIVSVTEIAYRIKQRMPLRGRVGITFDDGFKDNFTNAFPVLKKFNIPATIYLITESIETGNAPWFIQFRHAFHYSSINQCEFELAGKTYRFQLDTPKDRNVASDEVMIFLQGCENKKRIAYLEHIINILKPGKPEKLSDVMMNWDDVRIMSQNGIKFGAHTHTHPVLSSVSTSDAEAEILKSKKIIENKLDMPVEEFAYPVGKKSHFSDALFPVLQRAGFKYAVTTSRRKIDYNSNCYALSRPYPWDSEGL